MNPFTEAMVAQGISWVGALAILGSYAASRFWKLNPTGKTHAALNAIGGFMVAGAAIYQGQMSIVALEGTWGAISVAAFLKREKPASTERPG